MGHQQLPAPLAMENIAAKIIVNVTAKQKRYRAINMIFYWVKYIIRQNNFRIFWEEGGGLAGYVTKHHPI